MYFYLSIIVYVLAILIYKYKGTATAASLIFDLFIVVSFFCTVLLYGGIMLLFKCVFWLLLLVVALLLEYFFYSNITYISIFEFSRSFRFIFYLFVFLFFTFHFMSNDETYSTKRMGQYTSLYFLLLVVMFLAYCIQVIILHDRRPALFSENNFEIPALVVMMLISFKLTGIPKGILKKYLYLPISFLSLSRSGFLGAAFVFIFNRRFAYTSILMVPLLIIFSVVFLYLIASSRGQLNFESLDRFRFFLFFLESFLDGRWYNYLFGYGISSELPKSICLSLDYYAVMNVRPEYCSSTIFHSFFMKVFYDFGILGALFFILVWFFLLKKLFGSKVGLMIFCVISISSLSVSGFSNSIIIWPIYLFMAMKIYLTRGCKPHVCN